ncbi:lipoprotein NlpI [compost metagenome]
MRNIFYFFLCLVVLSSCGDNDDAGTQQQQQLPAALVNPMIRPLTEAIAADTGNAKLYYQRSLELNKMGQDSLTLQDLMKAVALAPDNMVYRESLTFFLIDKKKAAQAMEQVKILQQKNPKNATYTLLEAEAFMAGNELAKAEVILNDLMTRMPGEPDVLLDASRLKAAQKDTAQAIEYAKKVLEVTPKFFDGLYQLADLYSATGNAEALKWYDKIYRLDTLNPNPLYDAALFYQQKGDLAAAKKYFVKTIYVDKDFTDAYIQYGKILLTQDSVSKAERQFNIAIEVAPNSAEAYYQKGLTMLKQHKKAEAKTLFNQALVFNRNHTAAQAALKAL